MKCVVINLADQTERWEAVASQFERIGLPVDRHEAVRGSQLSIREQKAIYSAELNRKQHHLPLTPGEVGCYASHIGVWRALLRSRDWSWAVFEDDVTLHRGLPDILQAAGELARDWSILKLIGRSREKVKLARDWIPGHRLIRYRRVPSHCSAYLISRLGAEKMLQTHIPFGRPVDIDLRFWWESGCRIFGVQPYPVSLSVHSQRSTIGSRAINRGTPVRLRRIFLQWDYTLRNWRANLRSRTTPFPESRFDGHPRESSINRYAAQ